MSVGLDRVSILSFVLCSLFRSGVDWSLVDRSAADVHRHSVSNRLLKMQQRNGQIARHILVRHAHKMLTKPIVANVQIIFQKKFVSGK